MAYSRYQNSTVVSTTGGKKILNSSFACRNIRIAVQQKRIAFDTFTLAENQRLDIVAANYYGNAEYWWIIAAASGIGWQCQVPAGTVIRIPTSLDTVRNFI